MEIKDYIFESQLDEGITSEKLKETAKRFSKKPSLSTSNIKDFNILDGSDKEHVKQSLKEYNKYANEFNSLRDKMLKKAVPDAEMSSTVRKLKDLHNKTQRYHSETIKYQQKGTGSLEKEKIKERQKKDVEYKQKEKERVAAKVAASKNIPPLAKKVSESWKKKVRQYLGD